MNMKARCGNGASLVLQRANGGERVLIHPEAGEVQIHLWNGHHHAAAKHPSERSDNEQRTIKWAMEHDGLEEMQGAAVRDDERN
jgi:hypothetical protein